MQPENHAQPNAEDAARPPVHGDLRGALDNHPSTIAQRSTPGPIDDVTAIELKAVAGATIPLVDKTYTTDAAATAVNDGTTPDNTPYGQPFLPAFPYLSNPKGGYSSMPGTPGA